MPHARVRVTVKGIKQLNDKLSKLMERVKDPEPVINDIANYMVRVVQHRIVTSKTGPDGKRWAENSDLTKQLKGGSSPLYASGSLASSIRIIRTDKYGFSVGSKLKYALYNQNGVKILRGKYAKNKPNASIPARPFAGFSETNKVKIAKMIRDYIKNGERNRDGES